MLTRSKIKMEESIHRVEEQLPYFNDQHSRAYISQQHLRTDFTQRSSNPYQFSRNEVIKQLQQEYQILKNLNIQQSTFIKQERLSEDSLGSSSLRSKKSRESDLRSPKQATRELQSLHLQKKQLEIVIGNSMRKIEQLLNNQISLKKTIHELKGQLEGRGGVHAEYQKNLRNFQKKEQQLQNELSKVSRQNQKQQQRARELSERVKTLQAALSDKQRELKLAFEQQRRIHDLLRSQKDKVMFAQVQVKSIKMEQSLQLKERDNQINQLRKQLQMLDTNHSMRDANQTIRRLEEELRERQIQINRLTTKIQRKQSQVVEVIPVNSRNYLEEFLYRSKEMNQQSNQALTESVNIIMSKMLQIEKKNELKLQKEVENIKKRTQEGRRNNNEESLLSRVTELERMIQKEVIEKTRLAGQIKAMREHRHEIQDRNKAMERKLKDLQQKKHELISQIRDLENRSSEFGDLHGTNHTLKQEIATYTATIKEYETRLLSASEGNRSKEKELQESIRILSRQVDQANFRYEKATKEGEFSLKMRQTQQTAELNRCRQQIQKLTQLLRQGETNFNRLKAQYAQLTATKQKEVFELKNTLQSTIKLHQEQLLNQKTFYEEKVTVMQRRFGGETTTLNERMCTLAGTNQKLITQMSSYSLLENEVIDLKRILKQTVRINQSVDHLWSVKEAEYSNINDILNAHRF